MKVKDLIKILSKQDKRAEVILFEWIKNRSVYSALGIGATQQVKGAFIVRSEELTSTWNIDELIQAKKSLGSKNNLE